MDVKEIDSDNCFFNLRDEWQLLLQNSDADPLFCSWEWQYSWWQIWGGKLGVKLRIVEVREQGKLLALLPLLADIYSPLPGLNVRRLQFVGNHWRSTNTVRSEYLGPIIDSCRQSELVKVVSNYFLENKDWDEFLVCDQSANPCASVELVSALTNTDCRQHIWKSDLSYQVNTVFDFDAYLKKLGKNTRLKLFNRRSEAQKKSLMYSLIEDSQLWPKFFQDLNDFHKHRWGKDCFEQDSLNFHRVLLEYTKKPGCMINAELSQLEDESGVVSVLYNLHVGDRVDNIQSGYMEKYDKKISLGTLHLGYAIERSCEDPNINEFDLLAGFGKNSNYKAGLASSEMELHTVSCVRSKWFKFLLACYQILPQSLASIIVRAISRCVSRGKT